MTQLSDSSIQAPELGGSADEPLRSERLRGQGGRAVAAEQAAPHRADGQRISNGIMQMLRSARPNAGALMRKTGTGTARCLQIAS